MVLVSIDELLILFIGQKIDIEHFLERNKSHTRTKDASRPSLHWETISCACMISPPSRRRSLPHCSMTSGINFPETCGETSNRVAKPFVRTLRTVPLTGLISFGATSSYCGSAMNCLYIRVKILRHNLQSSSLFDREEGYLGGFPSCSSVRLYKSLICRSCDRSVRCWSMLTYGFRRLWMRR